MLAEQNKAIVRRWVEGGWNGGNLDLVDEFYADDYILHDPAMPVSELRQQVEILVVDVHRPRRLAIHVDRVALGDLLDVLVPLVAVVSFVAVLIRWHGENQKRSLLNLSPVF